VTDQRIAGGELAGSRLGGLIILAAAITAVDAWLSLVMVRKRRARPGPPTSR
jgi:hypothetical protein